MDAPAAEASTDALPPESLEQPPAPDAQAALDQPPAPLEPDPNASPMPDMAANDAVPPAPTEAPTQDAFSTPPPAAEATSGEPGQYTVRKGDTLMKIAFETYGDFKQWRKILAANQDKITDPNRIPSGLVLNVEKPANGFQPEQNGEKYEIKKGDTLGTISREVYGTPKKWKKIWENNKQLIQNPNKIYAGFHVYYTFGPEDEQEKKQAESTPLASSSSNGTGMSAPSDQRLPANAGAAAVESAPGNAGPAAH